MNCPRCGGLTYIDPDGDRSCLLCGWRDYGDAPARILAEEDYWRAQGERVPGRRRRRS